MRHIMRIQRVKPLIFMSVLLLTLLAITASCTSDSSDSGMSTTEPPSELTMLSIAEGQVFVMKSGANNWIEAGVNTTLEIGDTLKAGDDSRAEITFFEGSTIELEAGAEVEVLELGIAKDTGSTIIRLKQVIGNTVSRVQKLTDANSTYEVETPTAVAAVRGSIMFVRVREDGVTAIGNGEGNISVTAHGEEVVLPEGTYSTVGPGQAPSAPKEGTGPPSLAISKTADKSAAHVGDTITYTYLVTNTGGTSLSYISITDDKTGSTTDTSTAVLGIGETWEFSANYVVSSTDPDILTNTAVVSGTDPEGQVVTAQATASVTIMSPSITITKTAEPAEVRDGESVTYTYTVTNTGNTTLSAVTVDDSLIGNVGSNGELEVGESWELTAIYTVSINDSSPLVNTATASATDGQGLIVTGQASASVEILRPTISLTKTAEPAEVYDGESVTYTYTVTNTGNTTLSAVTVDDDLVGNVGSNGELEAGESWELTATYTVSTSDSSPLVNIATASATDGQGRIVTGQASASVEILRPAISLTKTAEPVILLCGGTVTYTYTVTNTGNTALSGILVNDNLTGEATYQSGDSDGDGTLDVGETWIFTSTYTVSETDGSSVVNTATVTGSDPIGRVVIAEASASVSILIIEPPEPELTVTITSPENGDTITTNTITVTGTVSDPTITTATIDISGNSHAIGVSNGSFSTDENVSSGENVITVTVTNAQQVIASDTVTINVEIPVCGIRIQLTWDTDGTDVDVHLVRPGGTYENIPDDCYYLNKHPDWGLPEVTEDNPSLDQDVVDGYGPENITLWEPYEYDEGYYQVIIHYYDDHGYGPTTATVKIWINDELVETYQMLLVDGQVWLCAMIDWASGEVSPGGPQ